MQYASEAASKYLAPAWGVNPTFDLTLPSGGLVLVKKIAVDEVIEMGLMDKLDSFSSVAGKGKKKQTKKEEAESELREKLGDPGAMGQMVDVINLICLKSIVEPRVLQVPEKQEDGSDGERVEGAIYIDRIPFTDRSFIFEKCFVSEMGGEAFEQFREGPKQAVGAVEKKPGVSNNAKSADANEAGA